MHKKVSGLLAVAILPFMVHVAIAQEAAEGGEIFNSTCAHCHGSNGQGGTLGPNILNRVTQDSDRELISFLRTGNAEKGMPPVVIPDAQMPGLLAYLDFLAANYIPAGDDDPTTFNPLASMPAIENFRPVTDEMLENPDPGDWLMFSRTYDAQRSSPLDEINRDNVGNLTMAWSRGLPEGITETIPTVYDGIMYLTMPDSSVAALDATTGDLIWRYKPEIEGRPGRSKTMSIYQDMVYLGASDGSVIAIDAVTGKERWRTPSSGRDITSGTWVVDGKVLSAGTCRTREDCVITAHDALTGELVWSFYTTQSPDDPPGYDTWGGVPLADRRTSAWGLPGSYDPETNLIYWGIANPSPYTRYDRHGGNSAAVPYQAPVDLYSDSTVALDPDTGELAWYYQHLPGDDWDEDMNQERIIFHTKVNPDPDHVKWINPDVVGQERDVIANVGEGGGLWVLDKHTGEFLWALPFPEDHENFLISDIDVNTGLVTINADLLLTEPGAHRIICYFNTRSYWPSSYDAQRNTMYVPFIRNCLNMTSATPATEGMPAMPQSRIGISAPGTTPEELNGMAKINMETGEITYWHTGPVPTTASILTTAGNLLFWGDVNRRFRAQDMDTGEVLWETILGGPISTSNITYSVDGRQYVAVITGNNLSAPGINTGTMGPVRLNLDNGSGNNLYVFALPEER